EIAPVPGLGELSNAAHAADLIKIGPALRTGMRCIRLNHSDQSLASAQRIVDHSEIARLEYVERHLSARQQQSACERKHRNDGSDVAGRSVDRIHRHGRSLLVLGTRRDRIWYSRAVGTSPFQVEVYCRSVVPCPLQCKAADFSRTN